MDKWEKFLEALNSENEFDKNLKNYLCAIKEVSEIKAEDIDDSENRKNINEQLKIMVDFINKYSDEYYEISLTKGFKANEEEKIKGRDYYYYIADQKMKASVYYVRYLNFINEYFGEAENARKLFDAKKLEIKRLLDENVDLSEDNVIGIMNDHLLQEDENQQLQSLRQECIKVIERMKAKDISCLKYMLFNNMMREIRFIGGAYQYLWHWETKTKNLFRYVSYDGNKINIEDNCPKKILLQNMFGDVISHMNKSSGKLCSYSEDPYVDIFKYLKIKSRNDTNKECEGISQSSPDIKISIEKLDNENRARFDIIKGVWVNTIYRDGQPKSFYDFVQDGKPLNHSESVAYAVELYPALPEREKNKKETSKNIKNLLVSYLRTWCEENVKGLMSYVADDKEVVTHGTIEKESININNHRPSNLCDGYRYTMEIDKDELIYLLLKLKNSDVEKIAKQYKVKLDYWYAENEWIKQVIKGEQERECEINGRISAGDMQFDMKVTLQPAIKQSMMAEGMEVSVERFKKEIEKEIEVQIKTYFSERYHAILCNQHFVANFILNFIHSEGHKCPSYISEYNEYEPDEGDKEISILKRLIFKKGLE